MDNTLFDFIETKIQACKAIVNHLDAQDHQELLNYFMKNGKGIENPENIADYLRDKNLHTDAVYKQCVDLYETKKLDTLKPYEGIKHMLSHLKQLGIKLGLLTDATIIRARQRLEKTDLLPYFDIVVSSEEVGDKKPASAPFNYVMQKLGVQPENTLLVGDSLQRDIEPGNKLGLTTVYAAYGDRNYFENCTNSAHYTINHPSELKHIIEKFG